MITGIDHPTSGEVLVAGTPVHTLKEGEIAKWRGRNVGVVFQFFQLLPTLTVIENVMLPMDFCNMFTRSERRARALDLLDRVEMADQAFKLPTAISGGQQQRVAIARALANDPPIIVADEPTGNLDSRTADAVFHLFEELINAGTTILMVTHDEDLAHRATRLVTIADGRIVQDEQTPKRATAVVHGAELPVNAGVNATTYTNGHVSQPVPGRPIEHRAQPVLKLYRGNSIDCRLGEKRVLRIDVHVPAGIERCQQFAPLLR